MANVKLRVNMILEGNLIPFNSFVDLDKIPPRLRKKRYILRPGEHDYDADNLVAQEEAVNTEVNIDEVEPDEDEPIRTRLANRRGAVRRRS